MRLAHLALAAGALVGPVACARPWIGDIRPEVARSLIRISTDPYDSQLGGLVAAEISRYRRAQTRHITVDSSAAVQLVLVVGLTPNAAAPGDVRLTGRLVNVATSVVERSVSLVPADGRTWRDLVPELVHELLRRPS